MIQKKTGVKDEKMSLNILKASVNVAVIVIPHFGSRTTESGFTVCLCFWLFILVFASFGLSSQGQHIHIQVPAVMMI